MFDQKGRVWFTSRVRNDDNPPFCKEGSSHPSAKLFPLARSSRHLAVYDPKTKQVSLVGTCFATHHLQFAEDANHTLWTSSGGGGGAVGWLNTKMWDETHDEEKSQGWTALILDTNGNGKRDAYVEPDQPVDPSKDKRINAAFYGVVPSPADGSIWGTVLGFPGAVVRLNPGSNPPATALAEIYELPWNNPKAAVQGFGPRGLDIDRNGVVWAVLASGHFASFDRRKCKGPLNGPTATGQHCPEGWTLYPEPGPQFKNVTDSGSAEASYYAWVDQFDTFGAGKNVPIATGNGNDALHGAGEREVGGASRALSDEFLRQGHGWPHRRSEDRLEGQGPVVDVRDPRAISRRNRQRNDEQGSALPASPRSSGEVTLALALPIV